MGTIKTFINSLLQKSGYMVINFLTFEKLNLEINNLKNHINDLNNHSEQLKKQSENFNNELQIANSQITQFQNRYEKIISHLPVRGLPDIRLAQTITRETDQRVKIADRLITAYHKAIEDEKNIKFDRPDEDLWSGVNFGFLSSAIMKYLNWNSLNKNFYLLDTFNGLDKRFVSDKEIASGLLDISQERLESGYYLTDIERVKEKISLNGKILK